MGALSTLIKLLVAAAFFAPLVVVPQSFIYPFIVPKILYFRAMVDLALAVWVVLAFGRWDRYRPRLTPITLGVVLFLLSFAVSTFLGVDPHRSMWDTHERMLGLYTVLHFCALYLLATTVFKEWSTWRNLLWFFLLVAVIVCGIGMYQRWGDTQYLYNKGAMRVSSTLGHPSYLGGLGAFAAFTAFLLGMRAKSLLPRLFAIACGIAALVGVVIADTRGTIIGLGVGVFVLACSYTVILWRRQEALGLPPRLRKALLTAAIVLVVLSAGGGGTVFALRHNPVLKKIPGLERFYGLSTEGGTARTRMMAWGIAWEAFQEHPVFGWGPNDYYFAYNKYYNPEFLRFGWQETWFDNAHNVLFNTLAVQGAVGLLLYLFLLGAPVFLLWRAVWRCRVDIHVACFGTAFLATHVVHNIFVFENPTSWMYFVLFLAFLDSRLRGEKEESTGIFRVSGPVAITAAVAAALLIWFGSVDAARANMLGLDAVRFIHQGAPQRAAEAYRESRDTPAAHVDGVRNMLAEAVLKRLSSLTDGRRKVSQRGSQILARDRRALQALKGRKDKESTIRRNLLEARIKRTQAGLRARLAKIREELRALLPVAKLAYDGLGDNAKLHPLDVRVILGRAKLAQKLHGTYPARDLADRDRLGDSIRELEAARPLSPRRQEIAYLLSALLLDGGQRTRERERLARARAVELRKQGRQKEIGAALATVTKERRARGYQAAKLLRATIDDEPRIGEGYWRLALIYESIGDLLRARQVVDEARTRKVGLGGVGNAVAARIRARTSPRPRPRPKKQARSPGR